MFKFYWFRWLLIASLCSCWTNSLSVLGQDSQAADDLLGIIRIIEITSESDSKNIEATKKLMQRYRDYQRLLEQGKIDPEFAKVFDQRMGRICRETWEEVGKKYPNDLTDVVSVGSYGTRSATDSRYKIGFSDKDFMPRGSKASEAAKEFERLFEKGWGISPAGVDVNALDPTDVSTWKGRKSAIVNFEKYNTVGGLKSLELDLYNQNPDVLQLSPDGTSHQVKYRQLGQKPPKPLTPEDAMGYFSDNTKFREAWNQRLGTESLESVLEHQAKYDLRNLRAFELAGGKLSADQKRMLDTAKLLSGGKKEAAIGWMMQVTNTQTPQEALSKYRQAMDAINSEMGNHILREHVDLLAKKGSQALKAELAASLANLPNNWAKEAKVLAEDRLGKEMWNEVADLQQAYHREMARARYGTEYFDEMARRHFSLPYNKLTEQEKAILHGAVDADSFGVKVARVTTGVLIPAGIIYTVHEAYTQSLAEGNSGNGPAIGRFCIDLLQLGMPALGAAELAGRLVAGVTDLCANQYMAEELDTLYAELKKDPSRDMGWLLSTYGADRFSAGALRQLADHIRAQHPGLEMSDELLDRKIYSYFQRRLEAEQHQDAFLRLYYQAESWLLRNGISLTNPDSLSPQSDNEQLNANNPSEYARLMGNLLALYENIRQRFIRENRPADPYLIWAEVYRVLRPEKTLPAKQPQEVEIGLGRIRSQRHTQLTRAKPLRSRLVFSVSGAFREKSVGEFCDPGQKLGPFQVEAGGEMKVTLTGSPAVPARYSLRNHGAGLVFQLEPHLGRGVFGPAQDLGGLRIRAEETRAEQMLSWPTAGRISVQSLAPQGAGPLTGVCYGQAFSARGEIVAAAKQEPVQSGTTLYSGDRLTSDPHFGEVNIEGSNIRLIVAEAEFHYHPGDDAPSDTQQAPAAERIEIELLRGAASLVNNASASSDRHRSRFISVKLGEQVFEIDCTDVSLILERQSDSAVVRVYEGEAPVRRSDVDDSSTSVVVVANQQIQLPSMDTSQLTESQYEFANGIRFDQVLFDTQQPVPFGQSSFQSVTGKLPAEWYWEDPHPNLRGTGDAVYEVVDEDKLRVVVPHENVFYSPRFDAPRLLRKITGDFDISAAIDLETKSQNFAGFRFLVFSPDVPQGYLSGQTGLDGWESHYWQVGGFNGITNEGKFVSLYNHPFASGRKWANQKLMVRISRRQDLFFTWASFDQGKTWEMVSRSVARLPDTLWAGWVFQRFAADGLADEVATFMLSDISVDSFEPGRKAEKWVARSPLKARLVTRDSGFALVQVPVPSNVVSELAPEAEDLMVSSETIHGDFVLMLRVRFASASNNGPEESELLTGLVRLVTADLQQQLQVLLVPQMGKILCTSKLSFNGAPWGAQQQVIATPEVRLRFERRLDQLSISYQTSTGWSPLAKWDISTALPLQDRLFLELGSVAASPTSGLRTVEFIDIEFEAPPPLQPIPLEIPEQLP